MPISAKATQDFIPIKEIRDSIVILKDGSIRTILLVSSTNFSLKSEDERKAILLQYQNFLNSLDFPIQIFVQSRRLDIRPYLQTLDEALRTQTNELLKVQTREYIEFIKTFAEDYNVMQKSFFVSIPYHPPIVSGREGFLTGIFGKKSQTTIDQDFSESRSQLEQKVAVVEQGLRRLGLQTVPLGTEELIELFFKLFNPEEGDAPPFNQGPNEKQ
ncbi:MAG: hypothetical protein UT40_C0009G0020 [Candidatus Woesebacteria bacterium GW2011_GWA1_39_21b]|uniref:TraC-like domain-containing protein n=2 Tax=Patescibacteria group TaxID=1783273 RepID=A0A1G2QCU9_9BACT|nr:MAG: hypothetical protein UT40_C0009G0020 [Candidatus Woesebacteria bacterium GW2011_GWA1_39_21b]KKS77464.1 MAG: hypothetical protein UV50_C0005G0019 [Parcubacteria group bacterium GW2011_GWB1_42_9]KKS88987.1 MAG: hypothetical protein UV64_C0015G0015 [Parcubacteria group bacterium GW2011_GWC1_43_11b]OHA57781.1 MAG: hypothetical protein A2370_02575 [Candidatus Vogelbacteria bacterium RIFOXYB1_FULL_42_16]